MFEIELEKEEIELWDEIGYYGRITIGNWSEQFFSPTVFWTKNDYLDNWQSELNKILNGKKSAKLITKMYNPKSMNFFMSWVLYRDKKVIYIQQQAFFLEDMEKPFDLDNFYKQDLIRETHDEDGDKLSEWKTTIFSIEKYMGVLSNGTVQKSVSIG